MTTATVSHDLLFPQLWPRSRVLAAQEKMPPSIHLPCCTINGEDLSTVLHDLPNGQEGDIAVVVTKTSKDGHTFSALLSTDLQESGLTFNEALRFALGNLKAKTKAVPVGERWESHPSGCATSKWRDGLDSARCALLPSLLASRKRAEGDEGGVVCVFATNQVGLACGSKNPLGLCFAGDVANVQFGGGGVMSKEGEGSSVPDSLCSRPWRLVKALPDPKTAQSGSSRSSPLVTVAGKTVEGQPVRVWRWISYQPGPGEFSVPRDQAEVDAVLAACEAQSPVPVFSGESDLGTDEEANTAIVAKALALKEKGNASFLKGNVKAALAAYGACLAVASSPSSSGAGSSGGKAGGAADDSEGLLLPPSEGAKCQSNVAACFLKLGGQANAAKALRAALQASKLDPTFAKAYLRAGQALEALEEPAAAAEATAKGNGIIAAEKAAMLRKREAAAAKREAAAASKAAAEVQAATKAAETNTHAQALEHENEQRSASANAPVSLLQQRKVASSTPTTTGASSTSTGGGKAGALGVPTRKTTISISDPGSTAHLGLAIGGGVLSTSSIYDNSGLKDLSTGLDFKKALFDGRSGIGGASSSGGDFVLG